MVKLHDSHVKTIHVVIFKFKKRNRLKAYIATIYVFLLFSLGVAMASPREVNVGYVSPSNDTVKSNVTSVKQ